MDQERKKINSGSENRDKKKSEKHNSHKKITRKQFFQRIGIAALVPVAGIWYSTAEQAKLGENDIKTITIPGSIPEGVTFHDLAIVVKQENKIDVLSSKCTHLGCIINKFVDGHFVCPCHGSEFSETGKVVRGPANKPLKKLPFKIDPKTGEITVNVVA